MLLSLQPCRTLKKLVGALKELVVVGSLRCHADGLTMQAMDSAQVCVCTFRLAPDLFRVFSCPALTTMGVHLPTLDQMLGCAKDTDTINLEWDEADPDVLTITVSPCPTPNEITLQFQLNLMTIETDQMDLPEHSECDAEVRVSSVTFARVCKELRIMGNTCTIQCTATKMGWGVTGDVGKALTVLQQAPPNATPTTAPAPPEGHDSNAVHITCNVSSVTQSFSLKYLQLFAKFGTLAPYVDLQLTADGPMLVQFRAHEQHATSYVRLYLAPKSDNV